MIVTISLLIIAYLAGSISSSILLCRILGLPDPRGQGSGNAGATNVLRFADKKIAIYVLLGDLAKGLIMVLLARYLKLDPLWVGFVALAVIVGHVWPIYFHFQGGKGVATCFGCLLALSWPLALIALAVWLGVVRLFHYSSLASMTAIVIIPIAAFFLVPAYCFALILMALLVLWKHQSNIQRLLQGSEPRIGQSN